MAAGEVEETRWVCWEMSEARRRAVLDLSWSVMSAGLTPSARSKLTLQQGSVVKRQWQTSTM